MTLIATATEASIRVTRAITAIATITSAGTAWSPRRHAASVCRDRLRGSWWRSRRRIPAVVRLLRRHSSSRISAENTLVRDSRYVRQFPLSALLSAVARAQGEVVRVMLIVCGLPPLTDNLALAKSYSERMFQAEVLGALTPPEDINAFVHPILESHRALDPGLGELVRADTEGFAFHIQFFGAVLWDALLPHEPITCKRFHQLRPEIVDAVDH